MFRKPIVFLSIILTVMTLFCASTCASTSKSTPASTSDQDMRPEEKYILSKHNPQNNLVYFFIERANTTGDFYAFIISDQLTDDQMTDILVNFTNEENPFPVNWYNKYSPVVIQDDFNGIAMAAFSFPKSINQIRALVELVVMDGDNMEMILFPENIEINNNPVQYYFIKNNTEKLDIIEIDKSEKENQLNRSNGYATQLGERTQLGFIKGPENDAPDL